MSTRWNQKKTVELVARAKGMRAEKFYVKDIAARLGVAESTIHIWTNPKHAEASRASCSRYKKENPQKIRDKINSRNATPEGWSSTASVRCHVRARKIGVPCDLTAQDVIDALPEGNICPVLGVPLQFGQGVSRNNPSVDRIIPSLGYVKGNIAVISFRANTMKQDATVEEVRALLNYMENAVGDHSGD